MALTYRTLFKNCFYLQNITKPVKWSVGKKYPTRILASGICYQNSYTQRPLVESKEISFLSKTLRQCSTQKNPPPDDKPSQLKLSTFQRLKRMYRDYWYVLVPVHVATSIVWLGGIYYTLKSGIDIIAVMQSLGFSESIISNLRDSDAGYFALSLAIYKMLTPLRYTVTLGGTTIVIKKFKGIGYLKPVPSRERIKEILQEQRDTLQDRLKESKDHYQAQMKEKRAQVMQEMKRYKTDMRNIKNKVKKM